MALFLHVHLSPCATLAPDYCIQPCAQSAWSTLCVEVAAARCNAQRGGSTNAQQTVGTNNRTKCSRIVCELFHCSWNSILFESQTLCCRWSTAAMKRRHRWACSPIVGCQLSREGKLFVLLVSTFGCSTLTQYSFVTCFIFWV